ncbi:MAG: hypothetical protein IT249_09145 [Chitinophagaceae bacterium]|nr:hypothetical protein [Chitinophagaceae bacterium]
MKKSVFFAGLCLFLSINLASAQINQKITYPLKSIRYGLTAEGNFNAAEYPARYGVSGAAKIMIKAQKNHDTFNEYVIAFKALHSPATDGGFFRGFDKNHYNNISTILLTGGYRFNFGVPRYMIHHFTDEVGGWFIEANAGVSYIHYSRTWAPAIAPSIGYAIAPHLDLISSFTASWADTKKFKNSLFITGLGLQFHFQ